MTVYFNGEFVDKSEVSISPDDRGFVFGDGVYEVIRADQGMYFHGEKHFRRLERSLEEVRIRGVDLDALQEAVRSLLFKNDLEDRQAKLYLQITRGAAPRQHAFPSEPVDPTVYAVVKPHEPPLTEWEEGVAVILQPDRRWARCDIKSTALLPNVLANQAAIERNAFEAILEREGFITEGTHSTVLAVVDGTVLTHPLTHRVLPSITRDVVLDLCEDLDIPVRETSIPTDQIDEVDELILVGTTTGVMPVVQVEDRQVGDGTPGSITRTLQEAFRALEPA